VVLGDTGNAVDDGDSGKTVVDGDMGSAVPDGDVGNELSPRSSEKEAPPDNVRDRVMLATPCSPVNKEQKSHSQVT